MDKPLNFLRVVKPARLAFSPENYKFIARDYEFAKALLEKIGNKGMMEFRCQEVEDDAGIQHRYPITVEGSFDRKVAKRVLRSLKEFDSVINEVYESDFVSVTLVQQVSKWKVISLHFGDLGVRA